MLATYPSLALAGACESNLGGNRHRLMEQRPTQDHHYKQRATTDILLERCVTVLRPRFFILLERCVTVLRPRLSSAGYR